MDIFPIETVSLYDATELPHTTLLDQHMGFGF